MLLNMKELQKLGSDMLQEVSRICEDNNIRWYMAYGSALGAIRHNGPIPWDYDIDIYVPNEEIQRFLDVMKVNLSSKYWVDYRVNTKYKRSFPRIGLAGYDTEVLHIDVYRLSGLPENTNYFRLFALYSRILFVFWKARVVDIDSYYPDNKRRIITKIAKVVSFWIPQQWILDQLDKQAARIPLDEAKYASCPFDTQSLDKRVRKEVFDDSILVNYSGFDVRVPKNYDEYLTIEYGDWHSFPSIKERERQLKKLYEVKELK